MVAMQTTNHDLIQGASLAKTGNFTRKAAGGSFQVEIYIAKAKLKPSFNFFNNIFMVFHGSFQVEILPK